MVEARASLVEAAWKVDSFKPQSGLQISEKQNVSSPLTCEDSILWGASVTETWLARTQTACARASNHVSIGQCNLIHLTFLTSFSWPSLAYMCRKVA